MCWGSFGIMERNMETTIMGYKQGRVQALAFGVLNDRRFLQIVP